MTGEFWTPEKGSELPTKVGAKIDLDHELVTLKGGPYGEKGKEVVVHKKAIERQVVVAPRADDKGHFQKGVNRTMQRFTFVRTSEPLVWRPRSGEEVPV